MATYRSIATTETDPEAPVTSALMKALEANPTAIAEAAVGAPRIVTSALMEPTAGTAFTLARSLGFAGVVGGVARGETLRVLKEGNIRVQYDFTNGSGAGTNNVVLYRHGASKTAMDTRTGVSGTGVSVTFSVSRGDMLYFEVSSGAATAGSVSNIVISSGVDAGLIG